MSNLDTAKEQRLTLANNETEVNEKFIQHIVHNNAAATHDIRSEKFDLERAKQKSRKAEMPCLQ